MAEAIVGIVIGSDSDWATMQSCAEQLDALGVAYELSVLSAHRSPEACRTYATGAAERGIKVIIAAAGMSAALAGVLAADTPLPVIGVPIATGPLQGVDALLATVQMPPGVPVATVGIGQAGAKNAAVLAVEILGVADQRFRRRIIKHKAQLAAAVEEKNRLLQEKLRKS